jgi:methylmalonyl-CoA mutase N-terminal domain/subunit
MVEQLTDGIEQGARAYLDQIKAMGGVIRAIETGFMKLEIEKSAYEYQKEIEAGDRIVVGVNDFVSEEEQPTILKIDPAFEQDQKRRLAERRSQRSAQSVASALKSVESAATNGENVLDPIIEAVKIKATVGEICDVLREVYGTFEEVQ